MNRVPTIAAALMLVAGSVLACAQISATEPITASSIITAPPATSLRAAPSITPPPAPSVEVAPSATGTTTAQLPVAFSGRVVCGELVRTGRDESPKDGGPVRLTTRGWAWRPVATMSDPRLEGDYYISYDSNDYESVTVTSVGTGTWRIENGEGAWQGSFTNIKYPGSTTVVSTALVGEGAYEGLTAVWESTNHRPLECAWAVRGLILEGDVPAPPEPYTGKE
jgi:hypothetical protein